MLYQHPVRVQIQVPVPVQVQVQVQEQVPVDKVDTQAVVVGSKVSEEAMHMDCRACKDVVQVEAAAEEEEGEQEEKTEHYTDCYRDWDNIFVDNNPFWRLGCSEIDSTRNQLLISESYKSITKNDAQRLLLLYPNVLYILLKCPSRIWDYMTKIYGADWTADRIGATAVVASL